MSCIAVVSDVHGNWTALRAVVEDIEAIGVDVVINGGDLVGNFPWQARLVDFVSERGWPSVVDGAAATKASVGADGLRWLQSLPQEMTVGSVTVVHASPGNPWNAPAINASPEELQRLYGAFGAALVVYGHLHQPFVRAIGDVVVANSGSVGMAYGGDPRAVYLLIDNGQPTIRRVAYEVEEQIRDLVATGYQDAEWVAAILRTGRYTPPR